MNLFAGSYTKMITPDFGGHGEGLYSLVFDSTDGSITITGTCPLVNPSYLTVLNDHLYTFNEVSLDEQPFLYAYNIDKNNQLKLINKVPVSGAYPCHINYSAKYVCLFVSCYDSGNVLVYPLNDDGSLKLKIHNIVHEGKSVNAVRQEAPHVHFVAVDDENDQIFVSDLGTDRIMIYGLQNQREKIKISYIDCIHMPEGSGPRHLVLHPYKKYFFVLTELTAAIILVDISTQRIISSVKLLPDDSGIIPGAAAIKISNDGKYIYASERSSNKIFVLKFDEDNIKLEWIQNVDTHVETPRDFLLDSTGNWLIVAGQDSDSLAVFKRNVMNGEIELHKIVENINSISCLTQKQ